jgi:hypothetical protein
MSKTIRFTVSDERYIELEEKAAKKGQSLQSYLRSVLFNEKDIYSPLEAYARALNPDFKSTIQAKRAKYFELRDLYNEDEWSEMSTGSAGSLGRAFYDWVVEHPEITIEYYDGGRNGKRARYRYK